MSRDQRAARVNVGDDDWIEFRTLAMRQRRSIADYLGALVRRELARDVDAPADGARAESPERSRGASTSRVRLADQQLLTELPRRRVEPPP